MRALRPSPRTLLLAASGAVVLLAALSDFQPVAVATLEELPAEGPGDLAVVVVRCRTCSGGYLLNITDGAGGWADAFCPSEAVSGPLANGTSVRLVAERSASDPLFLYIRSVMVVAVPTGND